MSRRADCEVSPDDELREPGEGAAQCLERPLTRSSCRKRHSDHPLPQGEREAGRLRFKMKARVTVTLKTGVLDPQGKAIEGALKSLGIEGVASVRQGKVFDIELDGDKTTAEAALRAAADRLLANTVIENYRVEVLG